MKPYEAVFFCLRIGLGALFAFSGFNKLLEPVPVFLNVVLGYKLVGGWAALAAAYVIPWTELLAGTFLVFGLWTKMSAGLLWALNSVFIVAVASVLWRGILLEDCGCFGENIFSLTPRQVFCLDMLLWSCFLAVMVKTKAANRFSLDGFFDGMGV